MDAGAEGEEEGGSGFGSCGVDEEFVGIVVFEVDVLRQRKLIGLLAEGRRESLLVDACCSAINTFVGLVDVVGVDSIDVECVPVAACRGRGAKLNMLPSVCTLGYPSLT